MNITILTNRDLASHIALSRLVKELVGHQLAIFLSEKVGGDQQLPQALVELAS
jgi:methylglyoxal synthase